MSHKSKKTFTKYRPRKRNNTGNMRITGPKPRAQYRYHTMAPEHDQWLSFTDVRTFGNGTSSQTLRFATNSYAPGGSGGQVAADYILWAAFYDFYRVAAVKIEIEASNNEAFPVNVALCTSNEDVGSTYPFTSAIAMPFARHKLLGAKGSGKDTARMVISQSIGTLVGSIAPESADSYRAIINADPADTTWAAITVESATGGTMVTGVSITCRITQKFRFYNADLVEQTSPPVPIEYIFATAKMTAQQTLDYIQARRDERRKQKSQ